MTSKKTVKRLAQFQDVKDVLDAALAAGGGEFELETYGKAVHWRQRAYTFRKLYAEEIGGATSKYDRLTFKTIPKGEAVVRIALIGQRGVFRPADGTPIQHRTEALGLDDDLLKAAEEFAATLDKDIL